MNECPESMIVAMGSWERRLMARGRRLGEGGCFWEEVRLEGGRECETCSSGARPLDVGVV